MARRITVQSFAAAVGAVILGGATYGCGVGGHVRAGIGRYEIGHYNEAAESCGEMRAEEADMNEKAHVRYLVYCGLTQYRLGNRADAKSLLTLGSSEYASVPPGWLKPAVVDEMLKALEDLGELEGAGARDGSVLSSGGSPAGRPDI